MATRSTSAASAHRLSQLLSIPHVESNLSALSQIRRSFFPATSEPAWITPRSSAPDQTFLQVSGETPAQFRYADLKKQIVTIINHFVG